MSPLVFIMKAVVQVLKNHPNFNASLDENGENLIIKKYFNLGIAVDTPKWFSCASGSRCWQKIIN